MLRRPRSAKITAEEKEAALGRALSIPSIADHPQLRNYLEFTGERVIRGEAGELTERIGALEALGKPPEFDPRLDPLVRSLARRLRRKLAHYYRGEGASDPVWVSIPRGQYLHEFVRRRPNLNRALPTVFIAALALGIVLLAWGLYQIWPLGRAMSWGPEESAQAGNALLVPFLHGSRQTVLVIYDLPLVEDAGGNLLRLKEGSPATLEASEPERLRRLLATPELSRSGALYPTAGYTGTGEALAGALLARYLGSRAKSFQARTWYGLSEQERENCNVILLGAPDMAAVARARGSASDFRFVRLPHTSGRSWLAIENLRPASGERSLYESRVEPGAASPEEAYALISFLPGRAPGSHWLVVAGATSLATLGAAEYLASGAILRDLPPRWSMVGGQPPPFEMLVKVLLRDFRPLTAEYVLHHLHER